MNLPDTFRKELAELLDKHHATIDIDITESYGGVESACLTFDIQDDNDWENNSFGNQLSPPRIREDINGDDIRKLIETN